MRRAWQISVLVLSFSGVVGANGIVGCALNSNSLDLSQCYSPNTFFTTPLTLDWGTAFGQSSGSSDNPHTGSWAAQPLAGVVVSVSVDPDFSSYPLRRVNNQSYVWDPSVNFWGDPTQVPAQYTDYSGYNFDGHFAAPTQEGVVGDGAHLLEVYGVNAPIVITFSQGVNAAGLLVSVLGSAINSDFDAVIRAYDSGSNLLATYSINTQGVGGRCAGLSNPGINGGDPTPCNDAPFVGIKAPSTLSSQQIYRIVVSASSGGGILLDSLQFQEDALVAGAPEPAVMFMCGGGLVLFGLWHRKRSPKNQQRS